MKKCPNCKAELPRDARFCVCCMTVLNKKTKTSPIKIIPRLYYCVFAVLLCLVLVTPILLSAVSSYDGRTEPGNPDTRPPISDNGEIYLPFPTDGTDLPNTNQNKNTFSPTDGDVTSADVTDNTSDGHKNTSTDTETESGPSQPTDTDASGGGNVFLPAGFDSGDGTESDPYIIKTAAQLNEVRFHLDAHFKLENDIVFTRKDFQSSYWIPIGMKHNPFTGVFDGNGYSVKNIEIRSYAGNNSHFGLFGMVTGTVRNLGVENVAVWVYDATKIFVGGVVGELKGPGATLENCHSNGNIRFESGMAVASLGGVVGSSYRGWISDCYNTGEIIALTGELTGGVVGEAIGGTVWRCYNTGNVSSPASSGKAGGILGSASKGTRVEDCYNSGNISAADYTGGIVGIATDESPTTDFAYSPMSVECCYNVGKVSARHVGGILGWQVEGTVKYCYYLNNVASGIPNIIDSRNACVGCYEDAMKQETTFVGFNLPWDWVMGTGNYPYPVLNKTE